MIGFDMGQYWESTEYQRQQLNLMREYRGRPPIPPQPRQIDFIEGAFIWSLHFALTMALFVTLALLFPRDPNGWMQIVLVTAPLALLFRLRIRYSIRLHEEYQETLRRWRAAGCP